MCWSACLFRFIDVWDAPIFSLKNNCLKCKKKFCERNKKKLKILPEFSHILPNNCHWSRFLKRKDTETAILLNFTGKNVKESWKKFSLALDSGFWFGLKIDFWRPWKKLSHAFMFRFQLNSILISYYLDKTYWKE